ncbi:radical SAM protein with 4Fe4S-binding SPASM domain [Nocardia kruczakiae]|uniref:Radical SAM protein with 4Fe4S-binding SPASM domain n=1 Tax=Nocardia kruczakiae TaxID=261477 RepID=A0ABU1XMI1_9NOCA|nr:radical SAM protein [Nocardia kruczakiae]MDR7171768.1 radical SAM protein with 4Fe4S-binding SPASM domain [Nocardia kruczakiae]
MVEQIFSGADRQTVIDSVSARYHVESERVARDLDKLVAELLSPPVSESRRHGVSLLEIDKRFDTALDFPLRLEIELTAVCNWNCGFCYNVWKIDPTMPDSDIRRAVRNLPDKHIPTELAKSILGECADRGCFVIRYSGGETLLHPDAMEIVEYGGSLGLYQVIFTNGHFITADRATRLAAANVRCVLVSIHGDREQHNRLTGHPRAYDKAVAAMRILLDAGIAVVAELTLVKENISGALDVIRDVYDIGVREFGVMRYVPTGRDDDRYGVPVSATLPLMREIDRLTASECPGMTVAWPCAQKMCTSDTDTPLRADDPTMSLRFSQLAGHCESGMVWASVSYDGQLRNCPHSNVYFGRLTDSSVADVWPDLTEQVHAAVVTRDTCSDCAVSAICRGGCHLPSFFAPKAVTRLGIPGVGAAATGGTVDRIAR